MTKRERSMIRALDELREQLEDARDARERYWLLYQEAAVERDNCRDSCKVAHLALHDAVAENQELRRENAWQQDKASDLIAATVKPFTEIEVIHGEPRL